MFRILFIEVPAIYHPGINCESASLHSFFVQNIWNIRNN